MNYLLKNINTFIKWQSELLLGVFWDRGVTSGNEAGFSIVESLIAISIVTLSITSATSIVQSSLQNTSLIKARSVAAGLAHEGVEYARNLRDTNYLEGNSFNEGDFSRFVATCSGGCVLDTIGSGPAYTACNGECAPMQKTNMGYVTSGGVDSFFVRTVTTEYNQIDGEDAEMKIVSEVSYRSSTRQETLRLESHLLDIL